MLDTPPEIIDNILDHLYDDMDPRWTGSTRRFTAYRLVCRQWLPRATFRLFGDILHTGQPARRLALLPELQFICKRIPMYFLQGERDQYRFGIGDLRSDFFVPPLRFFYPSSIKLALVDLAYLDHACISALTERSRYLTDALELVDVNFQTISDLRDIVGAATMITRLTLSNIQFKTLAFDVDTQYSPGHNLRVLKMSEPSVMTSIGLAIQATHLVDLALCLTMSTINVAQKLILESSQSLRKLRLAFLVDNASNGKYSSNSSSSHKQNEYIPDHRLDISSLQCLTDFHIDISLEKPTYEQGRIIMSALRSWKPSGIVHSLVIGFNVKSSPGMDWREVDDIIAGFPKMDTRALSLNPLRCGVSVDDCFQWMRGNFTRCRALDRII